ncbi:MAG: glycogen debranching N-terminal domain-containing protein [Candidatus Limnocylindria bacterium]
MIADPVGDVRPGTADGLLHRDTRFLSSLRFEVNGRPPVILTGGTGEAFSGRPGPQARGRGRRSASGARAGRGPRFDSAGGPTPAGSSTRWRLELQTRCSDGGSIRLGRDRGRRDVIAGASRGTGRHRGPRLRRRGARSRVGSPSVAEA